MWSDSMTAGGHSVRGMIGLAVLAAGLLVGVPDRALAGPSPFAGHYFDGNSEITVSSTGSIRAKIGMQTLFAGRIADDGAIALTYTFGTFSGDIWMRGSHGGGGGKGTTITVYGTAALDADGNLYGVVEWPGGSLQQLFWARVD